MRSQEQLYGPHFRGVPLIPTSLSRGGEPPAVRAVIASGTAVVSIAHTGVGSDGNTGVSFGPISQTSMVMPGIVVKTMDPGVGLVIGTANDANLIDDVPVWVFLWRTGS